MQPEWRQDTKAKDIYPRNLPQFELAGTQLDSDVRVQASKFLIARSLYILIPLLVSAFAYRILYQQSGKPSVIGRLQKSEGDPFHNKLKLRLLSTRRTEIIEGSLFDDKAQAGFSFLILEVELKNTANSNYQVNPFAFSVETGDGAGYMADLLTKKIKSRLESEKLSSGESVRGNLVFRLPKSQSVRRLHLKGMSGSVASVPL